MNESARATALAICRLLGDAANHRPLTVALPDKESVRVFSNTHRITTLVSCALRICRVSDEDYRAVHTDADVQAFHQIKADALSQTILERMRDAAVSPILLKGAALQAAYPAGWVRTATDTDLYISQAQLDRATCVLEEMGFVQSSVHGEQYSFQKLPRYRVELHTSLEGFTVSQRRVLDRLTQNGALSVDDHYVYTLFHLYKHFLHAGAGVRMFFDVYCLSRAVTDRPYIDRLLKELGLVHFERAVQTVNGILFDGDPDDGPMSEVIGFVFQSTAFGNSETYHALTAVNHSVTHYNRLAMWIKDYGFNRHAMTERYPVLLKHLWLYPFCCIHRVANGLLYKRTVLQAAYTAKHAIDRQQIKRILRTAGIL